MSLTPFSYPLYTVSRRNVDPFGLDSVLGDYDRQMRHMMRELNRMENQYMGSQGGDNQDYPTGLTSLMDRSAIAPRVIDQNGQKVAQFNFDIKGFKPEDVHIKTTDGRLVVSAKHEDLGEDHHAIREFRRMVAIPEGMQLEGMKSRLGPNGVLTISAPYTPPAIEQKKDVMELPIHHEKGGATNNGTKALKQ